MEFHFAEPALSLLPHINTPNILTEYIDTNSALLLYIHLTKKEVLLYNSTYAKKLEEQLKEKVQALELKKTPENEAENLKIDVQIAEIYGRTFDIANFISCTKKLSAVNPSMSLKIDVVMCKMRIGMILNDMQLFKNAYLEGTSIVDHGCDWDRRNKFKTYQGLYSMICKDYASAGKHFQNALTTFEGQELMNYEDCVFYVMYNALLAFPRPDLLKILSNPDVLEACQHEKNKTGLKLIENVYNSTGFVEHLVEFSKRIKEDVLIGGTADYFVRELKLRIYQQLLQSYKSLSLDLIRNIFGVGIAYVERDLCDFICDGRLDCLIDRVAGVVCVTERDEEEGKQIIEKGEKLMRIVKRNVK